MITFTAFVVLMMASFAHCDFFPKFNDVPYCTDPAIHNVTLFYDELIASPQMPAQSVAQRVGVPFDVLTAFFQEAKYWPLWDHLFTYTNVTDYSLCKPFDAIGYSNAPKIAFPPGMTAPHFIEQHGFAPSGEQFAFGWVFRLLAGGRQLAFGRHTFTLARASADASIVRSFEKAAGAQLAAPAAARAWIAALQESLLDGVAGFVCLERVYAASGALQIADVAAQCAKFVP